MRLLEPSWWYRERITLPGRLLSPIASAYGAISGYRMGKTPRYRSRLPVVCVGNFTAGGTGKTPTVKTVVRFLREQGHVPVVLSRGYGGQARAPTWVDMADSARLVGDEPCELAKTCSVLVARDRIAGAKVIEMQPINSTIGRGKRATIIVMDDGLQNPSLAKDVVISVVDAARGVGNGLCIPAGPLRAPLAVQLGRVDAIVLNAGSRASNPRAVDGFGGLAVNAWIEPLGDTSWLRGRAVIAFAGIGVPARFERTLAELGTNIRGMIAFPDHHAFTAADAVRLLKAADVHDALLITTEKDLVRLSGTPDGPLAELRARSRAVEVALTFDAAGAALLSDLLAKRVPLRH